MKMLDRVLSLDLFEKSPPVLVDIGASTAMHSGWKTLAKNSVCLAFDPDARQMDYIPASKKLFRQIHVVPAVVHPERNGECDFYLASSPECSSTLRLRSEEVKAWHFQYFFQLHEKVTLPCVTLPTAMKQHGLSYIDCLKIDTQGTDLRILTSLKPEHISGILSLELEPGPSVSYHGDDTPGTVIKYMESRPEFRLISACPLGSQYFPLHLEDRYLNRLRKRLIPTVHRTCPLWVELTYLNNLTGPGMTRREYLLAWVLAMIDREYGWALELAEIGKTRFDEPLFEELADHTLKSIPWLRPTLSRMLQKFLRCDR